MMTNRAYDVCLNYAWQNSVANHKPTLVIFFLLIEVYWIVKPLSVIFLICKTEQADFSRDEDIDSYTFPFFTEQIWSVDSDIIIESKLLKVQISRHETY